MAFKKTLLEMVQQILSAMDSDEVNSITDTIEAYQVAEKIAESYANLVVELDLPRDELVTKLTGLGDTTKPTYLGIPDEIDEICVFKYDISDDSNQQLKELTYLDPVHFHDMVSKRNESSSDVTAYTDFNGTELLIQTNKMPEYYTSFDDKYIVCDSFDISIESSLQQSKTVVIGSKARPFTISDEFIPDLPDKYFPLLLAEAKSLSFLELKQVEHRKAELTSRRQKIKLRKDGKRIGERHAYRTSPRP